MYWTGLQIFWKKKNIWGSHAYLQQGLYYVLAILKVFGVPPWFLTLSADLYWPEIIQATDIQIGKKFTREDIFNITLKTKPQGLRKNVILTNLVPKFGGKNMDPRIRIWGEIREATLGGPYLLQWRNLCQLQDEGRKNINIRNIIYTLDMLKTKRDTCRNKLATVLNMDQQLFSECLVFIDKIKLVRHFKTFSRHINKFNILQQKHHRGIHSRQNNHIQQARPLSNNYSNNNRL